MIYKNTKETLQKAINNISYFEAAEGSYRSETTARLKAYANAKEEMHKAIMAGMTPEEWIDMNIDGLYTLDRILLSSDKPFYHSVLKCINKNN